MKEKWDKLADYVDSLLEDRSLTKWWMFRYGSLDNYLQELGDSVKIYGASNGGLLVKKALEEKGIHVDCFIDSNDKKHDTNFEGLPVFSPGSINEKDLVVIGSMYQNEIVKSIHKTPLKAIIPYDDFQHDVNLFNKDFVINNIAALEYIYQSLFDSASREVFRYLVYFYLTRDPFGAIISAYDQYSHPKVRAAINDVIFDVGAYNGDTIITFMEQTNESSTVYAFEPEPDNCSSINRLLKSRAWQEKVSVIQKAVGDYTGKTYLKLDEYSPQNNTISHSEGLEISIVSLDDYISTKSLNPDLIKIDVEGYDQNVVMGAIESISKYKPKIQVAVYHKPDHLINIPKLLHEANPDYCFYLGHHQGGCLDTVLYAI